MGKPFITNVQKTKLKRAIERRFGQSIMPFGHSRREGSVYRITDFESGSWIEGVFEGRTDRLRITAERDGMEAA